MQARRHGVLALTAVVVSTGLSYGLCVPLLPNRFEFIGAHALLPQPSYTHFCYELLRSCPTQDRYVQVQGFTIVVIPHLVCFSTERE